MKKFFLLLLVALLPMQASAYDAEIDGIYYNFSGNNATVTYKNTNYNSYSGSVVIPETVTYNGQNYSVTSIGEYAFSSCSNLISITIGSGILTIGNNAFNSTSLRKIIWLTNTPPTGYQNVHGTRNYVANNQYSSLSNVTIYPFLSSLFEVDGVKYVPVSPSERTCDAIDCAYNESAENLNIGEAVTYRGISLSVKQVKPYLCFGNKYIKNVNLSSQCDVGSCAFYGCTNLTEATISNQGNIGTQAFSGCKNLSNATIHNVGSIEDNAFSSCSALLTAELGDGITSIGSYAFSGCKNLKSIVIPYAVSSIGSSAFQNCSSMALVKTGNGVKSIPTYAFNGCSSLKDVQIGTGVSTISTYAFNACSSLLTIQIPQNVTTISDYVFNGCTGLKTVLMNDGEANLNLGSNDSNPLFANCPLDSVYIGRNITYPTASNNGYSPFYRNTSLRSVTITDKETEISQNEFYGCTNLKNVRIGDGVTKFGDWAFSGCSSMVYFSFGSSVKTIGKEAFSDCSAMTKLISKAATPPTCGSQALDDINKWSCTLIVPQGCMAAYQQANQWKDFFFIEVATIPATDISLNQTTLSFNAANQTATLTATITPFNATNKNVTWTSSNTSVATVSDAGIVTSKANGSAVITATTTDGTNLTATCNVMVTIDDDSIINFVDANVKAICVANWDTNNDGKLSKVEAAAVTDLGSVFRSQTTIQSFDELQYFTGLTKIANHAFSACSSLSSITIPESVTSIEDSAFYCCYRLTSITIPDGVTSIGSSAFSGCSCLTSITIPDGVPSISDSAFNGCEALTSVTIPNSVTSIGNEAFQGCSGLTSVTIPNSITSIGNSAFICCYNLTSITIPGGVTKISDGTFEDCHALTSVTIGDGVTNIGVHAFNRCISLTSIIIPNSIKTISTYAYRDCRGLKSVTIGNGVTNMGENAFSGCLNLDSVHITDLTAWCNITFPDNMSSSNPLSYAHHLYLNGEEIKDLIIPNDVTRINKYAFYGCSGLNSVTIPNSVTTIGNDAFQNCTGLTSLALGNNVTSIGHSAFSGCGALTSITITSNMTFLGSWAFCNCCSLTSLVIPNGIKTIQKGTVYGCSSLTSITIPRSIAYIQDEAFKNCASLTDVWCYAEIVPKPDYYSYDNAFNNSPVSSATLHVPAESLESYKTTSPWSSFGNIVPLTQDEIDAVGDVGEDVAMDMEHFDLQGRIISKTQKGLNVIRMSDGSAKKVFMK